MVKVSTPACNIERAFQRRLRKGRKVVRSGGHGGGHERESGDGDRVEQRHREERGDVAGREGGRSAPGLQELGTGARGQGRNRGGEW